MYQSKDRMEADGMPAGDGFTLPGEAGYEKLTLELAGQWGADVIRDSDGTALSPELTEAGYGIYSTICIIRDHNSWAAEHPEMLQQTFLSTTSRLAESDMLEIPLMEDFFREQFRVNDGPDALSCWQVMDRTSNREVPRDCWRYDSDRETVILTGVTPWHRYSVSFLAFRIWEEISMYNHTTNNWDREHLMQLDPVHPQVQEYLADWMEQWCEEHPATTVVRFTSLFYNFVWIWGSREENRHLFTDWASYDFTVSPLMLAQFEKRYGYRMTAEDFVNKGLYRATHSVPDSRKRDWMEFVGAFVRGFGKRLVDIVHSHGKKACVFYDDSWVGLEPYSGKFREFGFDGMIKCVFSGFEVRLCAGVEADVHELRLHPYLFPVGLGGQPTFSPGGNPALDAKKYWVAARRALLRQPVERIGLGGYLHLVEPYPDFIDSIRDIADEFRMIRALHREGKPLALRPRVAILHAWGKLRTWTLSGHFHETDSHDLIHILESLSGLPLDVEFLSFEDAAGGIPENVNVIINAGGKNTAWSGGELWRNDSVVESLTRFVHEGGALIGVGEPSAVDGYDSLFRMAHVLGVDLDDGRYNCHGKWAFACHPQAGLLPDGFQVEKKPGIRLTDGAAQVLAESGGEPVVTTYSFGRGRGVYLSSFTFSRENSRMLLNLILHGAGEPLSGEYITDNVSTECAYFPDSRRLVLINNSGGGQHTSLQAEGKIYEAYLEPFEIKSIDLYPGSYRYSGSNVIRRNGPAAGVSGGGADFL